MMGLGMIGGGLAWPDEDGFATFARIPTSMEAIRLVPSCSTTKTPRECLIAYVWAFAGVQSGKIEYPKWPRRNSYVYLLKAPGVLSIEQIGKKIVIHIEDAHGVRVRP